MDLAVAFVALVISVVSLGAAIRFGRGLIELRAGLEQVRREHERVERELADLKAAAEVLPTPPPLPKTRPGGLDDLRQQLRQAHAEGTDE